MAHLRRIRARALAPRTLAPCRIISAILFVQTICATQAFHIYLHADEKRCFSDSAAPNTKILIEYTVSTGTGVMPVDLVVTMNNGAKTLVRKEDVEHGKLAFVLPFPEMDEIGHLYHAEAHRRHAVGHPGVPHRFRNVVPLQRDGRQHQAGDSKQRERDFKNVFGGKRGGRRLLSSQEDLYGGGANREPRAPHEPPPPPPPPPPPSAQRSHGQQVKYEGGMRDVGPNPDVNNYDDLDDDLDDLDMDSYDGIHDNELDDEMALNERQHIGQKGTFETASEAEKERELFETRQFELCLSNSEHRNEARRRRVKLVVHKGDSAHDYTRLAKREDMTQLEASLQHISAELHQLMRELDQTQQMENVLYRLNEDTNSRVVIMSVFALVTLMGVAAYQASYTKRFMKRKKLL